MINPFTLYRQDQTTLVVAVHHHHSSTYLAQRETLMRHHRAVEWLGGQSAVDADETLTGGRHALQLGIAGPPPPRDATNP
jgi:hypothetical protein